MANEQRLENPSLCGISVIIRDPSADPEVARSVMSSIATKIAAQLRKDRRILCPQDNQLVWFAADTNPDDGLMPLSRIRQLLEKTRFLRGETALTVETATALMSVSLNDTPAIALKRSRSTEGGVLVVGVESLLTTLARCCRPAPPDSIGGYVTRGKGGAIHRTGCSNFRHMAERSPERVIAVAWGETPAHHEAAYPVDVQVEASDRSGLLRDISEVFVKEKMNVTGVHTQSVKDARGGTAYMTFTVEVGDATRLAAALRMVAQVPGVRHARRR